jgi:hypothetical protein
MGIGNGQCTTHAYTAKRERGKEIRREEKNRREVREQQSEWEREAVRAVPHASSRVCARPVDQESGQIQPFETFAKRSKIQ